MKAPRKVAAVAAAEGLVAFIKQDQRPQVLPFDYKMNAEVVALARRPEDVGDLSARPEWHVLKPESGVGAWTDDYSNVLGAIMRKQFERWNVPAWIRREER